MNGTRKQTKTEIRAELMREIGRGQQMITGAEFRYGISREITREELDAACKEGNSILMNCLDRAEQMKVRLPY